MPYEPTAVSIARAAWNTDTRAMLVDVSGQFPAGATPFNVMAAGAAGAAVTLTIPGVAGQKNYLMGYSVAVTIAPTTDAGTVLVKDDGTAKITEAIPAAAPVGTPIKTLSPWPVAVNAAVNKAITIVASAPGGTTVLSISAWGYTV